MYAEDQFPPSDPSGRPIEAVKPRHNGLIAGIAVVVALAVVGGIYAVTSGGGSASTGDAAAGSVATTRAAEASTAQAADASSGASPSPSSAPSLAMTVPTAAGGLTLMTNSVGDQVKSDLSQEDSSRTGLESALFGAYEQTGSSQYFANLTLVELSDASASAYEDLYTSDGAYSALLNIEETDGPANTTKETPANSGGAMICGDALDGTTTLHMCTWIDATEYGLAVFPKSVTYAQADRYSLALWKASEHS